MDRIDSRAVQLRGRLECEANLRMKAEKWPRRRSLRCGRHISSAQSAYEMTAADDDNDDDDEDEDDDVSLS